MMLFVVFWQDAFFGRELLDKCKDNKPDDLDLSSDDDVDTLKRNRESKDPFEFCADSPPPPITRKLQEVPANSSSAATSRWQQSKSKEETSLVTNNLQDEDELDKDHKIGNFHVYKFMFVWQISNLNFIE